MLGLGEALLELDRLDEADAVLNEGCQRVPGDIWVAEYYARVATRRGIGPKPCEDGKPCATGSPTIPGGIWVLARRCLNWTVSMKRTRY